MRTRERPRAPTPIGLRVATTLGVMWVRDRPTANLLIRHLGGAILEEGAVIRRKHRPWTSR